MGSNAKRRVKREAEQHAMKQQGIAEREAFREKEAADKALDIVKNEYNSLCQTIFDGYQKRLNNYLNKVTPEMIQHIGYNEVAFQVKMGWQVLPLEVIKDIKRRQPERDIKEDEEILITAVTRKHFMIIEDKESDHNPVEEFQIWNTLTQKTEQLPSKTHAEIVGVSSLIGFISEKGIEHLEAERQTKKKQYNEESLDRAKMKADEAQKIIEDAIVKKDKEKVKA
jgi:hypothetical protein